MTSLRSLAPLCLAASLSTLACIHSSAALAILDGTPEDLDPAVAFGTVAVVIADTGSRGPDGRPGYYPSSGVVIARDWILTVKHAFAGHTAERYSWQVHFAPEIRANATGSAIHKVARNDVIPHPTLDLALVRVPAMPFGYQPVRIPDNWTRPAPTSTPQAVLAGFGPVRGVQGRNRLHSVEQPISATDLTQSRHRPNMVPPGQFEWHLEIDQRNGRGSCSGDSGGPVFIRDKIGQLGLVGILRGNASYNGEHPCLAYAYAVRVDSVIDWVSSVTGKLYNPASMSLIDITAAR